MIEDRRKEIGEKRGGLRPFTSYLLSLISTETEFRYV